MLVLHFDPTATYSLNQTADTSDFHDFQITADNTALVEAWRLVQTDLSAVNGPTDGWTFDCVVQEVDVAVGAVPPKSIPWSLSMTWCRQGVKTLTSDYHEPP